MSIRGTSNATVKTISATVRSQCYETGPELPSPGGGVAGGAGNPQAGSAEYRQIDNDDQIEDIIWISGSGHIPIGTGQVTNNE